MNRDLENVVKKRVQPVVESSLHKLLGVTIDELSADITEKLGKNPLIDVVVDTGIPFKKAKQLFKRQYIKKLLQLHYGNVSEAARAADIDRRSVHRFVKKGDIDVHTIRRDMARAYDIKQTAIGGAIHDVLEQYKAVLHPQKLESVYEHVPSISKDILDHLPGQPLSLKDAEEEFERLYLKAAIAEHGGNIAQAARAIGVRYETLHRKVKRLELV